MGRRGPRDSSETGSHHRRLGLITLLALVFGVMIATLPGGAGAVHDLNIFELDGNIADGSGGGAPDDWATLFPTNTSPQFVVARSFVEDGTGASDTGFTGGQSKDTSNVTDWSWTSGQVTPAKNNIANAYAAGYVSPAGHLILYFGQDRLSDQSGDASMGFWFLQDNVGPQAGGTFSGAHQTGDILIQTDLTNGGGISRIDIYKWDNGLVNITAGDAGECGSGLSGDTACGIANAAAVNPPWPYPGGSILSPYFFEGGVDVTEALGGSTPCFGSFLANTRTSQSESAVLKDFAGGSINTCGKIKIVKDASPEDDTPFGFTSTGAAPLGGPFTLKDPSENTKEFTNVKPGSYSVTETAPGQPWAFQSANCVSEGVGTTATGGATSSITLGYGGQVTCTYVNKRKPTLIVKKVVVNDHGGTKVAADFSFQVNAGAAQQFEADGQNDLTVDPGTYNVTEPAVAGYTTTYDGCSNVTLALGETKTCTITNNDTPATLTVIKHVINDNGGTAVAGNFTMHVSGNNPSQSSFPGAESPGTQVTIGAGAYTVTEDQVAGYSSSVSAGCSGTLPLGGSATCTITNNDVAPKLIVIKHVINDNGGTAVAGDFTMTVDDPGTNPPSFPGVESPGTEVTVDAGAYSVSEAGPAGYAQSLSADCAGTLAVGQTKTCTVTNNDVAPKLIVIKHVINDNGGTAVAGDFTMTVDDPGTNPPSFPGVESPGTEVTVDAGAYSVSEAGPAGYAQSLSADCAGTLAVGQTKTCTVTNDDVAPKLIVIKHVINDNGGTATASSFTMNVTAGNPSPGSFPGAEAPGTQVTLNAGAYNVAEAGPSGYAASFSADCTGSVSVGQTKTCTVTNDDVAAKLIVIKHVINDNGGTAVAGDFSMTVDDPGTNPPSFPGVESPGTQVAVDPGAYSVSETGPAGYAASLSADCTGTIAIGETKTCTVTNNDVAPKLIVIKHVINDEGGTNVAADFTMNVTGGSPSPASFPGAESPGTQVALNAGSYNVTETGPSGYTSSLSADCTGSIAVGQTKTCTVTNNDDIAPEIEVVKTANPITVPETAPGATQNVVFTYTIYNRSQEPLQITSLVDDKFDLATKCPGIVGVTLAKDDGNDASGLDQVMCTFAVGLSGNAGSTHVNVVTVEGKDDEGDTATDTDDATVTFTNVPSSITVVKTANPTAMQAPGGTVTFTVSVRNDSAVDTVTITSLVDSIHGNLNGQGTCSVPQTILPGATYTCTFTANVSKTETDVVTASGTDDDGNPVSDDDDATVTITPTPPPPPTTPETMDVAVVKDATAQVTLGANGTAVIDYEARVRNNGPNQAHNVTLADPAPSGVTFLAITQQPSQGSCSLTAALLSCNFGTLGPGVQMTVRWNARVSVTGSIRNVATATGQGTDTNGANNTDDAVTLVVAPVTPPPPAPKPKPIPKPAPAICRTLAVGPKLLQANGRVQTVTIKVVEGKKPAKGVKVRITGPGINRTVTTNAKGVVKATLKPKKAGILKFTITNAKACNTQRIGVVGVFEPPVTG